MTQTEVDQMLSRYDAAQRSIYESGMERYRPTIQINGDGTYKALVDMTDFDGNWTLEGESLTLVIQTQSVPGQPNAPRIQVNGSKSVSLTFVDGKTLVGKDQAALMYPSVEFTKGG